MKQTQARKLRLSPSGGPPLSTCFAGPAPARLPSLLRPNHQANRKPDWISRCMLFGSARCAMPARPRCAFKSRFSRNAIQQRKGCQEFCWVSIETQIVKGGHTSLRTVVAKQAATRDQRHLSLRANPLPTAYPSNLAAVSLSLHLAQIIQVHSISMLADTVMAEPASGCVLQITS